MSDDVLYVFAGRRDHAERVALDRGLNPRQVRYIYDEDQLRGIEGDGKTLHVCKSARHLGNFDRVLDMAWVRRFSIELVCDEQRPCYERTGPLRQQ